MNCIVQVYDAHSWKREEETDELSRNSSQTKKKKIKTLICNCII